MVACLGYGAMTGGAERSRCDAERRVESSDESKIGRYSLDLESARRRSTIPKRSLISSAIFRLDPVRFLATMMVKDLNLEVPLAQSAFSPLLSAALLKNCTALLLPQPCHR